MQYSVVCLLDSWGGWELENILTFDILTLIAELIEQATYHKSLKKKGMHSYYSLSKTSFVNTLYILNHVSLPNLTDFDWHKVLVFKA